MLSPNSIMFHHDLTLICDIYANSHPNAVNCLKAIKQLRSFIRDDVTDQELMKQLQAAITIAAEDDGRSFLWLKGSSLHADFEFLRKKYYPLLITKDNKAKSAAEVKDEKETTPTQQVSKESADQKNVTSPSKVLAKTSSLEEQNSVLHTAQQALAVQNTELLKTNTQLDEKLIENEKVRVKQEQELVQLRADLVLVRSQLQQSQTESISVLKSVVLGSLQPESKGASADSKLADGIKSLIARSRTNSVNKLGASDSDTASNASMSKLVSAEESKAEKHKGKIKEYVSPYRAAVIEALVNSCAYNTENAQKTWQGIIEDLLVDATKLKPQDTKAILQDWKNRKGIRQDGPVVKVIEDLINNIGLSDEQPKVINAKHPVGKIVFQLLDRGYYVPQNKVLAQQFIVPNNTMGPPQFKAPAPVDNKKQNVKNTQPPRSPAITPGLVKK